MYKKRYAKGEPITSLDELMEQEIVFLGSAIQPKGWFQNWQIRLAKGYVKANSIYKAVKIKEDLSNENN